MVLLFVRARLIRKVFKNRFSETGPRASVPSVTGTPRFRWTSGDPMRVRQPKKKLSHARVYARVHVQKQHTQALDMHTRMCTCVYIYICITYTSEFSYLPAISDSLHRRQRIIMTRRRVLIALLLCVLRLENTTLALCVQLLRSTTV